MNYRTTNEFDHFLFQDVHVADVQIRNGVFRLTLDDVKIKPENSANRDIRMMRANGLVLSIIEPQILSFIEEGYKIYDADGKLLEKEKDLNVEEADYTETANNFLDGYAYLIEKSGAEYTFVIDGNNERTYCIVVKGAEDLEEWDKFLNVE